MSTRRIVTIAVSTLLGLIAVIVVRNFTASARAPQVVAVAKGVPVVVATQPIARGVTLVPTLLKVVDFPKDSVPAGAFQAVTQLTGAGSAARQALRAIVPGEPVLASKITEPGGKSVLSLSVQAGMRAISLRSDDVAGVAGFVLPGDRVDVLLTRSKSVGGKEGVVATQALAQNVLVLAADQVANEDADKPVVAKSITLEVTPEQAQSISLAQSVGVVSLALRNVSDDSANSRPATFLSDIDGVKPRPARKPRRAKSEVFEVHVIRGVKAATYAVSRP